MSIPSEPALTPRRNKGNGEAKFMIVALLIILLGGGSLFVLNKFANVAPEATPLTASAKPIDAAKIDELFNASRHQKGDVSGADLTIVEFADFECPSCRRAYNNTMKTWDTKLPSHRMAFYHFPLEQMHPRAIPAAEASEAAAKQGKFWEMYAQLFDAKYDDSRYDPKGKGLEDASIVAAAKSAGLDMTRFATDYKATAPLKELIDADQKKGIDNAVDSTPTFMIHDKAGNVVVLAGDGNLNRLLPDLKNGILGDDKIAPLVNPQGQPITYYIGGKKESR